MTATTITDRDLIEHAQASVPVITNVDEMYDWFADRGLTPLQHEISLAGCRVGRNAYPHLLDWLEQGFLLKEALTHCVPEAWCDAEFPESQLDADRWEELFDAAGYTVDGRLTQRPTAPITLYRGAIADRSAGMSWTEDRDLAAWFSNRFTSVEPGHVYETTVQPTRVLAHFTGTGEFCRQGESEYVIRRPAPRDIRKVA